MSRPLPECGPGEILLPPTLYITPSNISPWRGAREPDQAFTSGQLTRMGLLGIDPDTCEIVVVRSSSSQREVWTPLGTKQPVYLMPCPILQRSRDRKRLQVLTPGGMVDWVDGDGTIGPRRAAPDRGPAASIGAKADYVRDAIKEGNAGDHHCHWPGCERRVPPASWGCREHWFRLPRVLRSKIWRAFRPGQEQSKTPSRAYVEVAREVQDWIARNGAQSGQKQ